MRQFTAAAFLALLCPAQAFADRAASFFDDTAVREIRLYFDDPNWYNTLLNSHRGNIDDPYFPCRFQSAGIALDRIGCRFKGNSSFQRNGIKKPFKLDFNAFDENASFFGLKKLNVNNFDLAPDFMREKLLHDFAGKYVAALRSVYVRLYVNDAFYGLYLAVEQPDKTMMQSRYGDDEDGNLYEAEEQMGGTARRGDLSYLGPNPSSYRTTYLLKTNEEANDYSGLIAFLDILNNTPTADLPSRLDPVCDIENWLLGMAINNLFVNLDSYLGVAAEYYLYDRDSDGKFVHIQWDHNESFGITGDGTPRLANPFTTDPFYLPAAGGGPGGGGPGGGTGTGVAARPLLQKLWAVDAYRRLYLQIFARFLREGFDPDTMGARVQHLAGLIREHVNADPNKAYTSAQFETALNTQIASGNLTIYGIDQFVRERYNYLRPWLNSQAQASDIRLNELVTVNSGAYRDISGDADPWVELHNLGPGPVTLSSFYLTDDPGNPVKWRVPARTLADGEYLVVWLDGEVNEGETHATFRLAANQGSLYLYSDGTQIDSVDYPALSSGQSYSREGYYGSRWNVAARPTAGISNDAPPATEGPNAGTGLLLINEVMADNDSAFTDPGEADVYEDWFEIYNPGATPVDMSGMYLTDNLATPTKWRIPNGVVIPARGYLVFIADNETAQGALHTNFSLSAEGELVALYQSDGMTLIDVVAFGAQQTDVAIGRTTDGAASLSLFRPSTPGAANALPYANYLVNGASFLLAPAAPAAIVSAFGENLAAATTGAASASLPTTLDGVTVTITDSAGATRTAPLYFVSATQVNFQVPPATASGRARVTLRRRDGSLVAGDLLVDSIAPGLFSANADGKGVGLLAAVRASATGAQTPLPAYAYDAARRATVAVPINLGAATDQVFLTFYGTGLRGVGNLANVTFEIGGVAVPVTYAGAQSEFPGLDQVNVGPLPRSLAGRGSLEVLMTASGRRANSVTVTIQ